MNIVEAADEPNLLCLYVIFQFTGCIDHGTVILYIGNNWNQAKPKIDLIKANDSCDTSA